MEWVNDTIRTVVYVVGLVGAAIGLCLAHRRVKAMEGQTQTNADRLLQERFQRGAELMGGLHMHTRMAGVHVLVGLAEDPNAGYRTLVEKFFLNYMAKPVQKQRDVTAPDEWVTDYGSRETVEVVRKLMEWDVRFTEGEGTPRTLHHILKTLDFNKQELRDLSNEWWAKVQARNPTYPHDVEDYIT